MLISILCTLAEGEAKVSNHLMLYVTLLPAHSTGIKMYSTCQEVNHNKCVSRLARRILHHTALSNAATCNSQYPQTVVTIDDDQHDPPIQPWADNLCRHPMQANVHQKERRPVRIVGQHACKISCPYLFPGLRNP